VVVVRTGVVKLLPDAIGTVPLTDEYQFMVAGIGPKRVAVSVAVLPEQMLTLGAEMVSCVMS
jgi:hypothetical protein